MDKHVYDVWSLGEEAGDNSDWIAHLLTQQNTTQNEKEGGEEGGDRFFCPFPGCTR